jgi:uncharacterized protein
VSTGRDSFDTLAPEFVVRLNGDELPPEALADLIRLTVLEDVEAPGMFTLTLTAWDTREMKPKWIDDERFDAGHQVEIAFGYRDHTVRLMTGDITALEPVYSQTAPPTFTVRGHDKRHELMRTRKTRSFTQCRESDVVQQMAGEAHLTPDVEDTGVVLPYLLQHDQTDWEFLASRAQRNHFECFVRDEHLVYRASRHDGKAEISLRLEVEVLEFRPRLSTLGQVPEFEVRGWDPSQKREIVGRSSAGGGPSTMSGGSRQALGPSATKTAFPSTQGSARVRVPVQSQDEADAIAQRSFSAMAMSFIRAEGVCIGDPRLRAGMVVAFEGVGERFGGNYYLTQVEHHWTPGQGYRTRFEGRRNAA